MRRIQLKSGRYLSFREYGDLKGFPVVFAHGNLNSSLFQPCWGKTDEITKEHGVRVIAIDRPGYGESDFEENRTYLGWTKDVADLVEELKLEKLVVAGYSSGGPHALACASTLAASGLLEKVLGVCLISSDGPYKRLGDEFIQQVYQTETPITPEKSLKRTEKMVESMTSAYNSIKSDEKREICLKDITHATLTGLVDPSYDMILETGDWFDLSSIDKAKYVHVYHGLDDHDVPSSCSQYIYDKIKKGGHENITLSLIEKENHTMIRRYWGEILSNIRKSSL